MTYLSVAFHSRIHYDEYSKTIQWQELVGLIEGGIILILYFSATGNTEFIAKTLAEKLHDECLNLLTRIQTNDLTPIHSETPFIICSPVFVCEIPLFLRDYLKKLPLQGNRDVYCIFNSGGYAGMSSVSAKVLFQRKGMNYKGTSELVMPRNYVATDMYPELDDDEIIHRIRLSLEKCTYIADSIRRGEKLKSRHVYLLEDLIILPFTPLWVRFNQPSRDFYAKDNCIRCGLCVKLCPINNITLEDQVTWHHPCTHCMACIGNCPVEAIEYGTITPSKKKYHIRKYLSKIKHE